MPSPERLIRKTHRQLTGRFPDKALRALIDTRDDDPRLQALIGTSVVWAALGGLEYFRGKVNDVQMQHHNDSSQESYLSCRVGDKKWRTAESGWIPAGNSGVDLITIQNVTIHNGVLRATGPGEHGEVSFDFSTSVQTMPSEALAHPVE